MKIATFNDWICLSEREQKPLHEIIIDYEIETSNCTRAKILDDMRGNWRVMRQAIKAGINNETKSASGLVGGDAKRIRDYLNAGNSYMAATAQKAAMYAIAVSEINAVMGRIVACPTAGSCGIVPAVLLTAAESIGAGDEQIVNALLTASGVGMIIADNASISGAEGGCQAECGTAAAMAAAAAVELRGGDAAQVANAAALALKNLLGLVCDPVAGLVEVPCVKRNGFAAVHALTAADMALAGIVSFIPVDEVISAMRQVGAAIPQCLRETSEAGLAATPTARKCNL